MTDRDGLMTIVVAGVTSGVAAASVNIAARFTSDPGDVLGFTGGVVGAGLAVLGALFVERRKAITSEIANQRLVSESLMGVVVSAIHAADVGAAFKWSRLLGVRQSFDGYATLRRALPFPQPALNIRLAVLEDWMIRWRARIDHLLAEVEREDEATEAQVDDILTLARQISITTRWVLGRPENWPRSVQAALRDMHNDADTKFPDRPTDDYEIQPFAD